MSLATDLLALLGDGRADTDLDVLQYTISFERLWSDTWNVARSTGQPTSRVIVWDGALAGHRLLLPHLTPLDWALAVSIHTLAHAQACANWSLHIVDLSLGTHRDCWAQRHAAALLDAMPWVRLYGPLHLKRRAYEAWRLWPVLSRELPDTPSLVACLEDGRDARLEALRSLAQSWQGSLQRSDEHHDLNNLVAPLLLSGEYCRQVRDPSLHAFRTKCRWIGAVPERLPALDGMTNAVTDALGVLPDGDKPKVILVDDMAALGWGELVKTWVGSDGVVDFSSESSPERFVQVLSRCTSNDFRYRSYNRSVCDASTGATVDEVIVWDLRLFGRAAAGEQGHDWRSAERGFYQQLLKVIDDCRLQDATDLAWPGFPATELWALREWLDGHGGELPDVALTLAPRCLSLLSPTTPIIVLSGTTRRSIVEALKPYGNVITGLEKPRPLDNYARDLNHIGQQWYRAWTDAASLLGVRRRLRDIETAAEWLRDSLPLIQDPNGTGGSNSAYVEVYIDETGADGATVGGVVAIYPSCNGVRDAADEFDDLLFSHGVCYYDPLVTRSDSPIPIKQKRTSCAAELATALQTFNTKQTRVQLFQFALGFRHRETDDKGESIRRVGDFKYFQTAATALEILLYSAIPSVLGGARYVASIYVGTRHLGGVYNKTLSPLVKAMIRDFGYDKLIGEGKLQSVSGNSVLPVVARIMSERQTVKRFTIDRALGVTLKYESEPDRGTKVMLPDRFVCRRKGCLEIDLARVTALEKQFKEERGLDPDPRTGIQLPRERYTGIRQYSPGAYAGDCNSRDGHQWVPDYRALHYVADEVLRSSGDYADTVLRALPGFGDVDDEQLRDLLLASRLMDQDEPVLALIRALTTLRTHSELGSTYPIRRLMLAGLLDASRHLHGNDLLNVAAAQRTNHVGAPRSNPRRAVGAPPQSRSAAIKSGLPTSCSAPSALRASVDTHVESHGPRPAPPAVTADSEIHIDIGGGHPRGRDSDWSDCWPEVIAIGLDRFEIRGWHPNGCLIVRFATSELTDEQWQRLSKAIADKRVRPRTQPLLMQQKLEQFRK
jgi:hypothetical protein